MSRHSLSDETIKQRKLTHSDSLSQSYACYS